MTQIRRRFTGAHTLQVESRPEPRATWRPLTHLVAHGYDSPFTSGWELRHTIAYGGRPGRAVLPLQPLSVRHLYAPEDGGRFLQRLINPLTIVPTGRVLNVPRDAGGLDFTPRLGFVLARELGDATAEQARAGIGAFVLTCEFTARGAGANPDGDAGNVGSAITVSQSPPTSFAEVVVQARDMLEVWPQLYAAASVNGEVVGQARAADASVDLGELLAAASQHARLLPGELFLIDALASAGGGRALAPGDQLVLAAPRLGRIEHRVA